VPLETRARIAAERLLLLTEAVGEAVLNDRLDEIPGLLASRQSSLDQLATMKLDAAALAVLERVREAERDLESLIGRSQGTLTRELTDMFSGSRQVKAYRQAVPSRHLQRTG
jgi:hypothetical protein